MLSVFEEYVIFMIEKMKEPKIVLMEDPLLVKRKTDLNEMMRQKQVVDQNDGYAWGYRENGQDHIQ